MPAPTIEFVKDENGGYWEVSYAGMCRRHRQDWQAWWLYELARAAYVMHRPSSWLPNSGTKTPAAPED